MFMQSNQAGRYRRLSAMYKYEVIPTICNLNPHDIPQAFSEKLFHWTTSHLNLVYAKYYP